MSRYLIHYSVASLLFSFLALSQQIGSQRLLEYPHCGHYNGTTENLREIVIGRCYEFLNTMHKDIACNTNQTTGKYNCIDIWTKFNAATIGKDPCDVKLEDYNDYLDAVDHPLSPNSTLFWSGTYMLAHEITRSSQFWSLEDTLSGYLLNKLQFCSRQGTTDYDMVSCPFFCGIINVAYWNAASKFFAQKAHGHVTVVLNGTRLNGAIDLKSTFYNYELPCLNSSSVSTLKVILLNQLGAEPHETCKNPKSLKILIESLAEKEISYECEDNPDNIIALFCFHDPLSKECRAIKFNLNSAHSSSYNLFFIVLVPVFTCFINL